MRVRFDALARVIRESVVENRVLTQAVEDLRPLEPSQFPFTRDPEKVQQFIRWLQNQEELSTLEIVQRPGARTISAEEPWTNFYVRSAYQRGIADARARMRRANYDVPEYGEGGLVGAFNQPFHADRVGLLYTRVFSELKGINEAMNQQISRVLSQAMLEGRNPVETAQRLVRVIRPGELDLTDTLGRFVPARRRAEILARTETIRAHHQASLVSYRQAGVEEVEIEVEFTTAGDSRVCPLCRPKSGKTYDAEDRSLDNLIPVHPQCRCALVPVPKEQ
jgi:SPP1 gp7 family putative phage head morphogenesis protein